MRGRTRAGTIKRMILLNDPGFAMGKILRRGSVLAVLLALLTACNFSYGYGKNPPAATPLPGLPATANLISLSFIDADHGWAAAADCPAHDPAAESYSCRGLLFRTADGGHTWSPLPRTLLSPRKIQFVDPDHGWMIGSVGERCGNNVCPNVVMITTDSGMTWNRASNVAANLVDLGATSEKSAWALGERCQSGQDCQPAIAMTESAGQLWTKHDVPLTGQDFRLQRIDDRSAWVVSLSNPTGSSIPRLALTRDGGKTWETYSAPCADRASGFNFRSVSDGWLLCAEDASGTLGLYTTSDGAKSWRQDGAVATGGAPAGEGGKVIDGLVGGVARPTSSAQWLALRIGRLETTSDGGKTWRSSLRTDEALGGIQFINSTNGWVLGTRHVWRTADGGQTWEKQSLDHPNS